MRLLRDMMLAGLLALTVPAAPARAEDAGAMALALAAADAEDWVTARGAAERAGPLAQALVGWRALQAGHGDFGDHVAFLRDHGDWPGMDRIRRNGDALLRPGLPPDQLRDWFADHAPASLTALEARAEIQTPAEAAEARAAFFLTAPLSAAEEARLLAAHGPQLGPLVERRIAARLDARDWEGAERLLPRAGMGSAVSALRPAAQASAGALVGDSGSRPRRGFAPRATDLSTDRFSGAAVPGGEKVSTATLHRRATTADD